MKLMIAEQYQECLQKYGIDVNDLLQEAGVKKVLIDERVEVSFLEHFRFLTAVDRVLTENMILEISCLEYNHLFVPTFLAAILAKDGYEALEAFIDYQSFICPNEFDFQETEKEVSITVRYPENVFQLPKFAVLFTQLSLLHLLRKGSGQMIVPLRIESPYQYEAETVTWIGRPVTLSKSSNSIVFSKDDLSLDFGTHSKETWRHLQVGLNRELASGQFVLSTKTELQATISRLLQNRHLSVELVAQELGMGVRTLQRKLVEEGTSYQAEVQAVKLDLAIYYMKNGIPTEEIAEKLGYTELAAFSRSFKKWTGLTISEFRKKLNVA